MNHFREAFLPNTTEAQRRDPAISPFYADLYALRERLPPALFTCGSDDALIEDSVFMSAKWMMAGGEACLKVYPGAPHAFILFEPEVSEAAAEAREDIREFLTAKVGGV